MASNKNAYINNFYSFLGELVKGKSVLDCGAAGEEGVPETSPHWVHGLVEKNASYCLGFDIEPDAVSELKSKGHNIVSGDCEDLHLNTDKKFDVIFAGEIIEHLSRPGNFLESVKAYMDKSNGILVITTPNSFSLLRGAGNVFGFTKENPQHVSVHNRKTLEQLLERHGFEICDTYFFTTPAFYENERMNILRKAICLPMEIAFSLRPQLAHQLLIIAKIRN